ncbi:hypothetical protein EHI46_14380 [Rhizobium leguminosarum]|nr:hypothetical protein EHI46_14380 [Rhizobium leguminosarum]
MGGDYPSSVIPVPSVLCPSDVTGIQRVQVIGRGRLLALIRFIHRADARWLDSREVPRGKPRA